MSIINIDESRCVGCNSCIFSCPSNDANIAHYGENGDLIIEIDDSKCIKCGECITHCTHKARHFIDETEEFFRDLEKGAEINLIVAPAMRVAFGSVWPNVLAWLRSKGVNTIYDVSYGADICTWAHLRYLEKNPEAKIMTQPCAAIVNYVLKHRQDMITLLSPIHSPMLCTAVYMKKYLNITGKIAAISPCIAKIDEFHTTGLVQYNVTMERLKEYIQQNGVSLLRFPAEEETIFDGSYGWEGAIYPKPGGLKTNLLYHNPDLYVVTSEGAGKVYSEIDHYHDTEVGYRPDVFDVLNCEFGCNDGPGVGKEYDLFQSLNIMNSVERKMHKKRIKAKGVKSDRQFRQFDKELKIEDFIRVYEAEDQTDARITESMIEEAYKTLHKHTDTEKHFNCHACGFDSCHEMAEALVKGINVPANCHQYTLREIDKKREEIDEVNHSVIDIVTELKNMFANLRSSINKTEDESSTIRSLGDQNLENVTLVMNHMSQLHNLNESIVEAVKNIDQSIVMYKGMTDDVEKIAKNINLLSLNASIEAGRAGEAGKSFAVVAGQIRLLSEESKSSVTSARGNEELIVKAIENIDVIQETIGNEINELSNVMNLMASSVDTTSQNSVSIQESMNQIKEMAEQVEDIIQRTNTYM